MAKENSDRITMTAHTPYPEIAGAANTRATRKTMRGSPNTNHAIPGSTKCLDKAMDWHRSKAIIKSLGTGIVFRELAFHYGNCQSR